MEETQQKKSNISLVNGSLEKSKKDIIKDAVRTILIAIGEDPTDDRIADTPRRFTEAIMSFSAYKEEPKITTFDSNPELEPIVVVKGIEVRSLCAHHLFPFFGKATIAYMPSGKKAGLSKFQRAMDFIANRLQDQENITSEYLNFLEDKLKPQGIMIKMTCEHTCMSVRGVKCSNSETTTFSMSKGMDSEVRDLMLKMIE